MVRRIDVMGRRARHARRARRLDVHGVHFLCCSSRRFPALVGPLLLSTQHPALFFVRLSLVNPFR